ncbi:MAG: hypothetical protein ABIF45_24135, partial [Pseudomonadota bacterium]
MCTTLAKAEKNFAGSAAWKTLRPNTTPRAPASREVLAQFPCAEHLAKVDIRRLTRILQEASRGQLGRDRARQLKAAAKTSFAFTSNTETLALEVRFVVERINLLIDQIDQLDRRIST